MAESSVLEASSKARMSSCSASLSRWDSPITLPLWPGSRHDRPGHLVSANLPRASGSEHLDHVTKDSPWLPRSGRASGQRSRPAGTTASVVVPTMILLAVVRSPPAVIGRRLGVRVPERGLATRGRRRHWTTHGAVPDILSETALYATSRRPTTQPPAGTSHLAIEWRHEVPHGVVNHPSIDGKDGVAGSIPAGGSTTNQQLRPGLAPGLSRDREPPTAVCQRFTSPTCTL
jgi:hypothetical protein